MVASIQEKINMPKLTKRFIESINPPTSSTIKYWDTEIKGFGVVVLPSGRRTYCIQYRNSEGIQKRLKIGIHGQISSEEARTLAKKKLGEIAHGEDPSEKKKLLSKLPTMKDLAAEYLEKHVFRKRLVSQQKDNFLIKRFILPNLAQKKVSNISFHDIQSLHLALKETPYQANRVVALLSKMFSLAVAWSWCSDNPVRGIQKYQEEKRDRWLNEEELKRLWAVLEKYNHHLTTHIFKLLLLTGARKGELLQATWDQFDLEKGIWTKPSHLTKQKKKEHLPLSENAINVLNELKEFRKENSPYLFPSKIEGQHLQEIKTFWKKVIKEAKLENVRIHDLRHTHASHLVSSGLSLSIVGKLLGHTQAATTHRYAHLADEPLRKATGLFGDKLKKLTSKELPSS